MEQKLTVTSAPHVRHPDSTRGIMVDVLIALTPALIFSVYLFGLRALGLVAVSVTSCVLFEYLYRKLLKKSNDIGDFSAAVTGLLLALNLPVGVPYWLPVIGAFFAIVVVKQLYGGIGRNFVNPALAARVFLMLSWPSLMSSFVHPVFSPFAHIGADAVSSATPLAVLKAGGTPDVTLFELLLGHYAGCIGETSAVLLMAGGLYLLYRRVISWQIPVSFLGTVALISFLTGGADPVNAMLTQLLSGGLMLGAIFMATDYTTSPCTGVGKLIFGVGCGLITVFIRRFGGYAEGVSFAILLMNLMVWFIDKYTRPRKFGGAAHGK
ncbi:RnfABCDGE type electron transport complex subunit D [Feifania hominis]|uniref:Ion-translocating oxidoreductase complex subunit D n=1 Tax=Feifania hominis TaxID=2763660 RepID=A0A926DFK6_9FIRM|nr:RnfABCDGE type electron transport complex subunit D [Feifania hominis]